LFITPGPPAGPGYYPSVREHLANISVCSAETFLLRTPRTVHLGEDDAASDAGLVLRHDVRLPAQARTRHEGQERHRNREIGQCFADTRSALPRRRATGTANARKHTTGARGQWSSSQWEGAWRDDVQGCPYMWVLPSTSWGVDETSPAGVDVVQTGPGSMGMWMKPPPSGTGGKAAARRLSGRRGAGRRSLRSGPQATQSTGRGGALTDLVEGAAALHELLVTADVGELCRRGACHPRRACKRRRGAVPFACACARNPRTNGARLPRHERRRDRLRGTAGRQAPGRWGRRCSGGCGYHVCENRLCL